MNDDRRREDEPPLSAWFLGPKAEHGVRWEELFEYILGDYVHWRRNHFPDDPVSITRAMQRRPGQEEWQDLLNDRLDRLLSRLKGHFPFYSPRYIAHMLSEQTLPSVLGYFAGMLYNPNNVTDEAAPVTVEMELEVGRMVAEMLGYDGRRAWAHLCSGGTIANLEGLWVARAVQLAPFMVRDYCAQRSLAFPVTLPDGRTADIGDVENADLIALRPEETLHLFGRLARVATEHLEMSPEAVRADLNAVLRASAFNPKYSGFHAVLARIGLTPVVFVSATAHYSVTKSCNVLGYGEANVRQIPVDDRFRMNVDALRETLRALAPSEYVAAVVGVVGSTEEGAVDPVHEIAALREERCLEANRSFWLHVDAAWGGYVASLLRGAPACDPAPPPRGEPAAWLREVCERAAACIEALDVRTRFEVALPAGTNGEMRESRFELAWDDPNVYASYLALAGADSITVDPHKLGYVPYPAGIIAFKDRTVIEFTSQRAQYIAESDGGFGSVEDMTEIHAIGPYILEGSKPGAAAAATWLAHTTIPLTSRGHGAIIRASLLSAQKLVRYLELHSLLFDTFEPPPSAGDPPVHPFTFTPIFEPDTNVVCFVLTPMERVDGTLVPERASLPVLNALTRCLYGRLSIPGVRLNGQLPYVQQFYVSRTTIEPGQYAPDSIAGTLRRLQVTPEEYEREGLFVLRSTVMNPLYKEAEDQGIDYLYNFVRYLHDQARVSMRQVYGEHGEVALDPEHLKSIAAGARTDTI